jgi:hypothetical protein
VTGAGITDQKYYGFGELYSPIQSLLAARQATTWSAIRRAVGQIDRIPHVAAGTEGCPHIAHLRQVRIADVFYPLPLGWRLSNLTQEAIRFQAGDGKRCAPDAASFKQTIKDFFAADCLQRVMYHELKGDDLRRAAETLRASAEARAALAATSPRPGDLADRFSEAAARPAQPIAHRRHQRRSQSRPDNKRMTAGSHPSESRTGRTPSRLLPRAVLSIRGGTGNPSPTNIFTTLRDKSQLRRKDSGVLKCISRRLGQRGKEIVVLSPSGSPSRPHQCLSASAPASRRGSRKVAPGLAWPAAASTLHEQGQGRYFNGRLRTAPA